VEAVIFVLHVLTACAVIGFVLLQHGKGADMGAAFGGGSSGSVFGSAGSANFLSRATAVLATIFFVTSIALTWLGSHRAHAPSLLQRAVQTAPAKSDAVPASVPTAPAAAPAPAGTAPKDAGSKAKDVPN
jgi:preprotein translocase subunit SecG